MGQREDIPLSVYAGAMGSAVKAGGKAVYDGMNGPALVSGVAGIAKDPFVQAAAATAAGSKFLPGAMGNAAKVAGTYVMPAYMAYEGMNKAANPEGYFPNQALDAGHNVAAGAGGLYEAATFGIGSGKELAHKLEPYTEQFGYDMRQAGKKWEAIKNYFN